MIEKIYDHIRFHFRKHEYEYHYWFKKLWRFILLWIKTWVIVALIAWGLYHATIISNGQWTDADVIWLIIDVITLIAVFAWYIWAGDDY